MNTNDRAYTECMFIYLIGSFVPGFSPVKAVILATGWRAPRPGAVVIISLITLGPIPSPARHGDDTVPKTYNVL